jgi:flagellar biosynthesis anti-sigma factor FlgM
VKINERDALNIPKPQSERIDTATRPNQDGAWAVRRSDIRSDQIDLGRQNVLLSQAQASGSEERASRVEQLRALVQSGRYQVDNVALSQSIVNATINGY